MYAETQYATSDSMAWAVATRREVAAGREDAMRRGSVSAFGD